jgi:hypothetical protein
VLVVSACLCASPTSPGVEFGVDLGVTSKTQPPRISSFYPARRLRCSAKGQVCTARARYFGLLCRSFGGVRVHASKEPLSLLFTFHCGDILLCGHPRSCSIWGSALARETLHKQHTGVCMQSFAACGQSDGNAANSKAFCRDIRLQRHPQAGADLNERTHPRHVGAPRHPHYEVGNEEMVLITAS